jgi:hypothetical protein
LENMFKDFMNIWKGFIFFIKIFKH